jgi:hypothetical protein
MRAEPHAGVRVKCPLFQTDFNQKQYTKLPRMKFYENPTIYSQAGTCRQTNMAKKTGTVFAAFHCLCSMEL